MQQKAFTHVPSWVEKPASLRRGLRLNDSTFKRSSTAIELKNPPRSEED